MTAELDDPRAAFIDAAFWHGSKERAGSDIYIAAMLGDADAVRRFIATIPRARPRKVGRGMSTH